MNGFDFTSDRVTFALHDPVKLAHVFPYGFDIGGGGVLRLVGSNFAHESSKCTFGARCFIMFVYLNRSFLILFEHTNTDRAVTCALSRAKSEKKRRGARVRASK